LDPFSAVCPLESNFKILSSRSFRRSFGDLGLIDVWGCFDMDGMEGSSSAGISLFLIQSSTASISFALV
jgi:hypothetical protein